MKRIAILGSTGSIGRQTLDVVARLPERFSVVALAAGENTEELARQIEQHRPELVSVASPQAADRLKTQLEELRCTCRPEIVYGPSGIEAVALHPQAELLVAATVGVVALPATVRAIEQGRSVALANKEVLVAGGELVSALARKSHAEIIPIDSEHSALHQCLRAGKRPELRRLVLTASGGPFRTTPMRRLHEVTPEQALAHPNWRMGRRITVDSATLMNKGFEVIEAHWLFEVAEQQIEVVIHPQSTVHSMVEFVDGSVVAQLGPPDMRLPIQYALTYPERMQLNGSRLNWQRLRLDFYPVPRRKFPCLELARAALRAGGTLPCALNAADEIAVEAFLKHRIRFSDIPAVVEAVLEAIPAGPVGSLEDLLHADAEARRLAREQVERRDRR
jgi:1-deoxy-D-xylulose-5-phosphate reductoisomerase